MLDVCGDRGEAEITDMMGVVNRLTKCTRESTRRRIRDTIMMMRMRA